MLVKSTLYKKIIQKMKGKIMMTDSVQLLTIRQVAEKGILSEHSLRLMSKRGMLPQIKIGNRVYINYPKLLTQLEQVGGRIG